MKSLLLLLLLFTAAAASAQTSVTIADLEKYMRKFDDTTGIIKALKQKKFKSDPNHDDRPGYYEYFFWKKVAGRITYSETVLLQNIGDVLIEYSNYLNQGLDKMKEQIVKAGFRFSSTPIDRADYKSHVYYKRFTEISDMEIQVIEEPGKYYIRFEFRQLEIKTVEQ